MKNVKFKILSTFCTFAILGISTYTSVNAMETFGFNVMGTEKDVDRGKFLNINSKNIDDNKISESNIKQLQDDIEMVNYSNLDLKDISDKNYIGEMNKNHNNKNEDIKSLDNSILVDHSGFEKKDNLDEKHDIEMFENFGFDIFGNSKFKADGFDDEKFKNKKLLNLEDINLKKVLPYIPKKNRDNLNNKNVYNNGNSINFNNNNVKCEWIGSNFNAYKLEFISILGTINSLIENKSNYCAYQLMNYYNKFFYKHQFLFSNYSNFLALNKNRICKNCDYEKEINNIIRDIIERLKVLYNEIINIQQVEKDLNLYKEKFQHILEEFKEMFSSKSYEKENMLKDSYNKIYNSYTKYIFENEYKIGGKNKFKNDIFEIIKIIDKKINKSSFKNFVFYGEKFDIALKKLMEIVKKNNYEKKDDVIRFFDFWWYRYEEFLKKNKNIFLVNSKFKDDIFKLIEITDKKKNNAAVIKDLIICKKDLSYVLANLIEIINKKTYEEKDNVIKTYDYWRYRYEEILEEAKNIIGENNEFKDEISKINKEISSEIKLIGIIKDLIWKRVYFDNHLRRFEFLKKNFDMEMFNLKKNDYENKFTEYNKCVKENEKEINGIYYLKVLKNDIDNFISKIEETMSAIEEKNKVDVKETNKNLTQTK